MPCSSATMTATKWKPIYIVPWVVSMQCKTRGGHSHIHCMVTPATTVDWQDAILHAAHSQILLSIELEQLMLLDWSTLVCMPCCIKWTFWRYGGGWYREVFLNQLWESGIPHVRTCPPWTTVNCFLISHNTLPHFSLIHCKKTRVVLTELG